MKRKFYNSSIIVLALISVILAIKDISYGLNSIEFYVDYIIWGIFVCDYIIRLSLAKSKKIFFKTNILDLIAILPFNSIFRAFRVLKMTKLLKFAKLAKLSRIITYILRGAHRVDTFLNTNGFKYILLITTSIMLIGGFSISYVEGMNLSDGLWWSFVTTTTVGYGDISPHSHIGRFIAIALMIVGIGLVGSLTSTITS